MRIIGMAAATVFALTVGAGTAFAVPPHKTKPPVADTVISHKVGPVIKNPQCVGKVRRCLNQVPPAFYRPDPPVFKIPPKFYR